MAQKQSPGTNWADIDEYADMPELIPPKPQPRPCKPPPLALEKHFSPPTPDVLYNLSLDAYFSFARSVENAAGRLFYEKQALPARVHIEDTRVFRDHKGNAYSYEIFLHGFTKEVANHPRSAWRALKLLLPFEQLRRDLAKTRNLYLVYYGKEHGAWLFTEQGINKNGWITAQHKGRRVRVARDFRDKNQDPVIMPHTFNIVPY